MPFVFYTCLTLQEFFEALRLLLSTERSTATHEPYPRFFTTYHGRKDTTHQCEFFLPSRFIMATELVFSQNAQGNKPFHLLSISAIMMVLPCVMLL